MSNKVNVCSDIGYQNSVSLKNRFRIFNIPIQRFDNLANSPYDISNFLNKTFTQDQLNMRRKSEILKYSATKSNTKTNNLTKREKWVQLINAASQQRNLSYSFIQNNLIPGTTNFINTCPSGTILYTPTSASGIPGKIMNLYEDPTVPLYMYSTNVNAFGIINQEPDTTQFIYDKDITNVYLDSSNNNGIITSIYIINILTPIYRFNIEFPISIFISATVKPRRTGTFKESISIYFDIHPFQSYVYYGSSIVIKNGQINNPIEISPSIKSTTFDVSMNLSSGNFSGNQYIGQYSLANLTLNTQPNFIYDICLNIMDNFHITTQNNTMLYDNFENIQFGICTNVEFNSLNIYNNCSIKNPTSFPLKSTYQMLSII